MLTKINYAAFLFYTATIICSCAQKNISKYYYKNEKTLDSIQQTYDQLRRKKPFTIEFTNKSFNNISIEIITDTLKYIYEFGTNENRMSDSLIKYDLNVQVINHLIYLMQSIHCTWVNNLDYYVDKKKYSLTFISIRPRMFYFPFTNKKYYILTYFKQPQYFDSEGRLLDTRKRRRIRKINEDVFRRINDKVAYTISDRFR